MKNLDYKLRLRADTETVVLMARGRDGPIITQIGVADLITFAANQHALRSGSLPYGLDG